MMLSPVLKCLLCVLTLAAFGKMSAQEQKPYILELSGWCRASEMSVEYFINGGFGGYASFVRTDSRLAMYEIPTMREGKPAKSLKIIIRGARCRTQVIDIPEVERGGRVIRTRLRRSRQLEFRGQIRSPELLNGLETLVTVEYWANWKCEFFGIPDCLIGPTRMDVADVKPNGTFKVRLPDLVNDQTISRFSERGAFQFFIRDRSTGEILFRLHRDDGNHILPVASAYFPGEFTLRRAEPIEK